jgi:predicted dehydrogenase
VKVAFVGASHWHLDLYLHPARDAEGVEIVGVSDPGPAAAERLGRSIGVDHDADFRHLCHRVKPDFVFVLGRHADMREAAEFLVSERIPFAIEKPCGVSQRDVATIAEKAERANVFAAVPLVFRNGEFFRYLRAENEHAPFQGMSFRFIAGFPERYRRSGCAWMLDPEASGGGATINLGIHFFDLCLQLLGPRARVTAARMSNAAFGEHIEDHAVIAMEHDGVIATLETGYLFPAPNGAFDMRYSLRSPGGYVIARDSETVEIYDNSGSSRSWNTVTTNVPLYRNFTHDALSRAASGNKPLASLADMVPVMALVDAAYAMAGASAFHPVG